MANSEPIRIWVEALRSGEYRQGKGRLTVQTKEGDLDCCLGVGCKVSGLDLFITLIDMDDDARDDEEVGGDVILSYNGLTGTLPPEVAEWLGIGQSGIFPDGQSWLWTNPLGFPQGSRSLIAMNDEGASFNQIADAIEHFWGGK